MGSTNGLFPFIKYIMNHSQASPFLIIGGDTDPNLTAMIKTLASLNYPMRAVLFGQSGSPSIVWDVQNDTLVINNEPITAGAAFIRRDVFKYLATKAQMDEYNANELYAAIQGWILSHPQIKVFNRGYLTRWGGTNKAHVLGLAVSLGLPIARTIVTNHIHLIQPHLAGQRWIRKPFTGGEYTTELTAEEIAKVSTRPAQRPHFIQSMLVQPELRMYRVGDRIFSCWVKSDAVDYRDAQDTQIIPTQADPTLEKKFMALSDALHLDYAAADFKTDPDTKQLALLEVNSSPMFAGFDQALNGQLIKAMIAHLAPQALG